MGVIGSTRLPILGRGRAVAYPQPRRNRGVPVRTLRYAREWYSSRFAAKAAAAHAAPAKAAAAKAAAHAAKAAPTK